MSHLLNYGLVAAMLFTGVAAAQAQSKPQPREAIHFNTETGCAKTEVNPSIGYNIDIQHKGTFLFLRLGPYGSLQAKTLPTLSSWSGRLIKLDTYSSAIVYQKLDPDVYVLNVTTVAEILVCQTLQNGITEPENRMPNPESVPGYAKLRLPTQSTPEPEVEVAEESEDGEIHIPDYFEPFQVKLGGCTNHISRSTAFQFRVTKPNQYVLIRSKAAKSEDEEWPFWQHRAPRLLPKGGDLGDIIEMTEHKGQFGMVKLTKAGDYWLFYDEHLYGDRRGDVEICIGSKSILDAPATKVPY